MLGLETAVSVISDLMVATGRMSWAEVAKVMSVNPARIAGMDDHGRALAVGDPAHITLIDPSAEVTVDRDESVSLSRNNPWHGHTFKGGVAATVYAGRVTYRDGVVSE